MSEGTTVVGKRVSRSNPIVDFLLKWLASTILTYLSKKLGPVIMRNLRRIPIRSILRKAGEFGWKASPAMAYGLGFVFQKNVLVFAGWLTLPWVVGIIGSFAGAGLYFHFIAKGKLRGFKLVTHLVSSRCWNIVIGGLSKAFFDLATGLLPFWQNPWIFVVLALYFGLILDVVWMKRWFGRAVRLNLGP